MIGKTIWVIPDGYMSSTRTENFVSHEAVCVLNLSETDAKISIKIFFEDKDPMDGFTAECKSNRSMHIRLDKITNDRGEHIPYDTPYSVLVESTVPIIAQHSRMDVSQAEMTLMTTIPY